VSGLEAIEKAVQDLDSSDLLEFRRWFAQFDAPAWDSQVESDAAAGHLDALAKEALVDYRASKAREI
jgi:hypothetical protein